MSRRKASTRLTRVSPPIEPSERARFTSRRSYRLRSSAAFHSPVRAEPVEAPPSLLLAVVRKKGPSTSSGRTDARATAAGAWIAPCASGEAGRLALFAAALAQLL